MSEEDELLSGPVGCLAYVNDGEAPSEEVALDFVALAEPQCRCRPQDQARADAAFRRLR